MDTRKYIFNENDNIHEIFQVNAMAQSAYDAQIFVDSLWLYQKYPTREII